MVTTDELMGGEWEQHARHLHVESDGWIRGHYVPTALHTVRNYARLADILGTRGALEQLSSALSKLEREIERYQGRMRSLQEQVGVLHGLVLRARDQAADRSFDELEDLRRQQLVDESDPGIDEYTIRRAINLHPRKR